MAFRYDVCLNRIIKSDKDKHHDKLISSDKGEAERLNDAPENYSMDHAKDYLLHLPKIDLTTDEAVVKNYPVFAKMEEQYKKISAFENVFLEGESLDPIYRELYLVFRAAIAYGKARMDVIEDPLYQQMTEDEVKALRDKKRISHRRRTRSGKSCMPAPQRSRYFGMV